jgi:hypothetical protein
MADKEALGGNIYPKYVTKDPVARGLINGYLASLDRLVASIDPPSIHEVGCGEGDLISRYVKNGRVLVGSDISENIIQSAARSAQPAQVEFKVLSVYDLEPEDSASLILCCEVLEHLEFPDKALEILSRTADPFLIASVPLEPLWRVLNTLRGKYWSGWGNTPGHLQHWSKRKFINFLESRFDLIKIETPFPWTMALCRTRK